MSYVLKGIRPDHFRITAQHSKYDDNFVALIKKSGTRTSYQYVTLFGEAYGRNAFRKSKSGLHELEVF